MSEPVGIDGGKTATGGWWVVDVQGPLLIVAVDGTLLILDGEQRDRFTEAVARAAMPGQTCEGGC